MTKNDHQMNEEININREIADLINAHGFETKLIGDKIFPNFKENIEIRTRILPTENENSVQTRFDIGVKFENGIELYEAFGDVGSNLTDSINKNIENFSSSSLHVFLDAFNDTNNFVDKEEWQIGDQHFHVFIGNFILKSFVGLSVEIPAELFSTIQEIISRYKLEDDYYFVRFFYAQFENEACTTEFMINNINLENEEQILANLNWMKSEDYYSARNFIILKCVKSA